MDIALEHIHFKCRKMREEDFCVKLDMVIIRMKTFLKCSLFVSRCFDRAAPLSSCACSAFGVYRIARILRSDLPPPRAIYDAETFFYQVSLSFFLLTAEEFQNFSNDLIGGFTALMN